VTSQAPLTLASVAHSISVPLAAVVREYLIAHKLRLGWSEGLFFGRCPQTLFNDSSLAARAATAWKNSKLEAITLHEARHRFALLFVPNLLLIEDFWLH
jgi:hypothetical protein